MRKKVFVGMQNGTDKLRVHLHSNKKSEISFSWTIM